MAINKAEPSKTNYASEKNRASNLKGISQVAKGVISYLQDVKNDVVEDIGIFVEKVGLIDDQFQSAELGTPFATDLSGIRMLLGLREKLGSNYATLIADPFILELKGLSEAETVENKPAVAGKLYRFMDDVLIPALKNASSAEEVAILEQFVDQSMALYTKIKAADKKGVLKTCHGEMISVYNAQLMKNGALYAFVLGYEDGTLSNLDQESRRNKVVSGLKSFVGDFIAACKTSVLSNEEKVKIYNGLVAIEGSFEKVGHGKDVSPIIEKLNEAFEIPQGMRSSYPIDLAATTRGNKKEILQNLHLFQHEVLIPYLTNASSLSQVKSAMPLISLCDKFANALGSVDEKGLLAGQKVVIDGIIDVKKVILNSGFINILALSPENVGDLSHQAYREKVVGMLTNLAKNVKEVENHPLFTKELKEQFVSGMKVMYREFAAANHAEALKPIMALLAIPTEEKKKVSSSFSSALAKFSSVEKLPENTVSTPEKIQKTETLEERKIRAFGTIETLIARLDPDSLSFKSDIADIIREIEFVKKKYPTQTTNDFVFLEKAMRILQKPEEFLAVTNEETMLMKHVAAKHGVESSDVNGYKVKTEARSIREAQVELISGLKKGPKTLEDLNGLAKNATHGISEKTMQKRFELFVGRHPLKTPLNQHFATHFPQIVRMLTNYSEIMALKEASETWEEIKNLYDGTSGGLFSKLVCGTYSYINPETIFPNILEWSQDLFINQINFQLVDTASGIDFEAYMEQIVKAIGKRPNEYFESWYRSSFAHKHNWLVNNIRFIKVPYNQGDEKDTNLGKGVCMSNSVNRVAILADNPDAPTAEITMGSTSKTRMHQARIKRWYVDAEKGKIPFSVAREKLFEQAEEFGITKTNETLLVNPSSNIHQNLVNQMVAHAKGGQPSFLVIIYSTDPRAGHAVNVHFDPTKNIYRLMDDNIGLLEYPDEATFKKELGEYFKWQYSTFNEFYLVDFAKR
ncbi:hypothetical protein [Simkania negevensis]|uniref:Uncharacterized protein n=1 Tax=Simkania negevensis (strain ATCC VR-1471 / DSM 27360 / Z) TaxID=331113 RepID=F8L517_SIMNZ|nr:hypothetical protein [Simkania negevensis]CCB87898.1 unknown protein [Simkania negevensis Z]